MHASARSVVRTIPSWQLAVPPLMWGPGGRPRLRRPTPIFAPACGRVSPLRRGAGLQARSRSSVGSAVGRDRVPVRASTPRGRDFGDHSAGMGSGSGILEDSFLVGFWATGAWLRGQSTSCKYQIGTTAACDRDGRARLPACLPACWPPRSSTLNAPSSPSSSSPSSREERSRPRRSRSPVIGSAAASRMRLRDLATWCADDKAEFDAELRAQRVPSER